MLSELINKYEEIFNDNGNCFIVLDTLNDNLEYIKRKANEKILIIQNLTNENECYELFY